MTGRACQYCNFFEHNQPCAGQCRKKAPAMMPTVNQIQRTIETKAAWPTVQANDWCGEFVVKGGSRDGKD